MSAGFIAYGCGVAALAVELRRRGAGHESTALAVNAAATVAVAALPLGAAWPDALHAAAAGVAYSSLAATPLLAARRSTERRKPVRYGSRAWSVGVGVTTAGALLASVLAPQAGLFQRLGLTIGDAWIASTALRTMRARAGAP